MEEGEIVNTILNVEIDLNNANEVTIFTAMKHDITNVRKAPLSTLKRKSTDDNEVPQKRHEALIQSVLRLSKRMLQIVNNSYAVIYFCRNGNDISIK